MRRTTESRAIWTRSARGESRSRSATGSASAEAESMVSCFYRHKAGENVGMTTEYRIERDPMGEVRVPSGALYGPQTQRAVDNFPVSGLRFSRSFLRALGM